MKRVELEIRIGVEIDWTLDLGMGADRAIDGWMDRASQLNLI
jgi:hypothetical protein